MLITLYQNKRFSMCVSQQIIVRELFYFF